MIRKLAFLPAIGALGGTIANTSGTGGGVVFVPLFNMLREWGITSFSPLQITAASFGIQCFGMTMGAARWTDKLLHQSGTEANSVALRDYATVVGGVLLLSLPAMLLTQRIVAFDAHKVLIGFKSFSILLGTLLLVTTWTVNRKLPERTRLATSDLAMVMLLAIPGGIFTAFFSVGTGELVALYLFSRHYPVLLSTGTACVISSVSVLTGSLWHIQHDTVPWEVVILAAPGALLGGYAARTLAHRLGARRLKTLDGLWILLSSCYLIILNWRG